MTKNNKRDGPPAVSGQEALAFITTGAIWAGLVLGFPVGFLHVFYCVPSLAFMYWALRVVFYADNELLKAIAFLVGFGLVITSLPAFVGAMYILQGL